MKKPPEEKRRWSKGRAADASHNGCQQMNNVTTANANMLFEFSLINSFFLRKLKLKLAQEKK